MSRNNFFSGVLKKNLSSKKIEVKKTMPGKRQSQGRPYWLLYMSAKEKKRSKQQMKDRKNEQKLKLIWDFRGPEGSRTAKHHAIHLKEYVQKQDLELKITGFEELSEKHSIAYMVVYRCDMEKVRDALKPHRGQLYEEK